MATRLATATQNAACNAQVDRIDSGTGTASGRIQVYTGAQPANANGAPSGTLLVEFVLANPAFGDAAAGVATLQGVPITAAASADGTAGWFRALDRAGGTVFDGSVTASGGGGQLELDDIDLVNGQSVSITAGTYTMPGA